MRIYLRAGFTTLALALLAAVPSAAQTVFFGAGPTFPVSDYGDYANTGFLAIGGLLLPVGAGPASLVVEGFYGQNGHTEEAGSGKTNPLGVMGGVVLDFSGEGEAGPYVFGEAGLMVHKYSPEQGDGDSETAFGFGGGAGYGFPLGGLSAWVEGRYMSASFDAEAGTASSSETTAFMGIVAGVSIPLGGN
jgi:hypothetical protein